MASWACQKRTGGLLYETMRISAGILRMVRMAVLGLGTLAADAADRREWVHFTNCTYVARDFNDGDSFRVKSGTNEFNVRLYFVDAPEPNLVYAERTREQSVHFGVTLDETLKAGAKAREFVKETLQKPFAVRTRWASAASRAREPRYYAIIEVGSTNLAEILVRNGLAWPKGVSAQLPSGEKGRSYSEKLQKLEADAREKKVGVWATAAVRDTGKK
jgi:endonuclease YncB( thermonuclease family)